MPFEMSRSGLLPYFPPPRRDSEIPPAAAKAPVTRLLAISAMMWEVGCRDPFTTAKPVASPIGHSGTVEALAKSRGDWTGPFGEMSLRAVVVSCGYGCGYGVGIYGSKAKEGCLSVSEGTLKFSNS